MNEKLVSQEEQPMRLPPAPAPGQNAGIPPMPSIGPAPQTVPPDTAVAAPTATQRPAPGQVRADRCALRAARHSGAAGPSADTRPAASGATTCAARRQSAVCCRRKASPVLSRRRCLHRHLAASRADAHHRAGATRTGHGRRRSRRGSRVLCAAIGPGEPEEAQSSFHAIQSRHADLLGNRQLFVRKKTVSGKIFYGAQVGPMSRQEAVQLCEGLKAAGGPCMLQHN